MVRVRVFKPPPPVGAGGGYIFSGRPSVRASVRPCVRDSRGSFHRGGGAQHSTVARRYRRVQLFLVAVTLTLFTVSSSSMGVVKMMMMMMMMVMHLLLLSFR